MTEQLRGRVVSETEDQRGARLGLTKPARLLADGAIKLNQTGNYSAALVAVRRAINLLGRPNAHLLNILGMVTWNLGEYDDALTAIDQSLAIKPDNYQAHSNRGVILNSMKRIDDALPAFDRSIELAPDDLHCKYVRAIALLDAGLWGQGLEAYESRIPFKNEMYPALPFPIWNGEDLNGKTLYIQAEQGIGDRILFSRYLSWVHETWPTARLLMISSARGEPSLIPLFWEFSSFVQLLPHGIPWPKADYGIHLMSIARIHGTRLDNVPPDRGLLRKRVEADIGAIELPVPHVDRVIKIGVAWTGNTAMARNAERSVPLRLLMGLMEIPLVQLYSLQFNDGAGQLAGLGAGELICDLSPGIAPRELAGSAAVIVNLDMVITCCTSVAHMAGALGVPTWVLLCRDPYWVWGRDESSTPWYPSVRLFRQPTPGDWKTVIANVKIALAEEAERLIKGVAA